MSIWEPIDVLASKVQSGEVSAISLVEKSLGMIAQLSEYNVVVSTTKARALERANMIDQMVKLGKSPGRLAGVPFIAKDNFLAYGSDTTASSNMLKGFVAPYQSTAIERLEAEGAIMVAKANLDAFAHGSSTENSDFFTTLNPRDKSRVAGGSSGGSSAAVVLDLVPFALGTDTGGSIRQPASFCGAVGLKPTYGLTSRSGVVAMASSLDCIGPMAMKVEDVALVLDVIAGKDSMDSTMINRRPDSYADFSNLPNDLSGKKVGVIKEYMDDSLDPGIRASIESSISKLKQAGASIEEVSLPSLPLALAVYYIICPAEISSNLSRYDGQRYGYSDQQATNLEESYIKSRTAGFNDEVKRRIMIGTYVLSSGYYDAYYKKAQIVRTKLINEFKQVFGQYDFLVGPTSPNVAFNLGLNKGNPLEIYLTDIMTVAANLVGVPAISLPSQEVNGLPVGFQVMADQARDKDLLWLAKIFEECS